MSRAPWVVGSPSARFPAGRRRCTTRPSAGAWSTRAWPSSAISTESMGETGENVAERYGISREDQDAFALRSHQRAVAAAEARRASPRRSSRSRRRRAPRDGHRRGRRGAPRPTPRREAGEAAAGLPRGRHGDRRQRLDPQRRRRLHLIASEAGAEALGAEPLARVVAFGVAGVDPAYMGIGPVEAIPKRARPTPASSSTRST